MTRFPCGNNLSKYYHIHFQFDLNFINHLTPVVENAIEVQSMVPTEFLLWPHVQWTKTECAEVLKGSEHALTDEVCLQILQITVIQPVNGHGSNFPLSNSEIWMYYRAASLTEWNYKDGHADLKHVPQVQKTVNSVSWDVQQRKWYYILKAFSCKSTCSEQFQRKIINWTIKHFQGVLMLCLKCSGDCVGDIERMLVWSSAVDFDFLCSYNGNSR